MIVNKPIDRLSSPELQLPSVKHRYTGVDYISFPEWMVNYKDVFHLGRIIEIMHEYCVDEGWGDRNDSKFPEKMYIERISTSGAKELWIRWRLNKKGNDSELFRWDLDLDLHVIPPLTEVEVMIKGQKFKMNKGEFELKINAFLIIDPGNKWKKHWLLGRFKDLIIKRLYRKQLEWQRTSLYQESYRFQEAMKTHFKLETMLPERELAEFWNKRDFE